MIEPSRDIDHALLSPYSLSSYLKNDRDSWMKIAIEAKNIIMPRHAEAAS